MPPLRQNLTSDKESYFFPPLSFNLMSSITVYYKITKSTPMKFKFTYTVFSLAFLALVFSSNSGGRASAANAGNTGAPGDEALTCVTCHGNSAAIQVTLSIDILDDTGASIVADGYVAGETYEAKVTINVEEGTPAAYGFQLLGLNAALGQTGPVASNWSDPGANVQIASTSSGRNYAEHKGASDTNEFSVRWTAPEKGSGDVSFYSCGNGINGNGETSGDNAACNTLLLTEKTNTNTSTPADELEFAIVPNPVQDVLQLETFSPNSGDYDLIITDILGRQVHREVFAMPQGEATSPIEVSQLQTGLYFLHLHGNGEMLTRQVIKK